MIRYSLKCAQGHLFESWFASSEAFERLRAANRIACTDCGETQVEKALMAPAHSSARAARTELAEQPPTPAQMLAKLRAHLENNSEDVGERFAHEARAIHDGEARERPIHGEAALEDARALIEDGIPVLPVPGPPKRKLN